MAMKRAKVAIKKKAVPIVNDLLLQKWAKCASQEKRESRQKCESRCNQGGISNR
jgi:hypothetical protein